MEILSKVTLYLYSINPEKILEFYYSVQIKIIILNAYTPFIIIKISINKYNSKKKARSYFMNAIHILLQLLHKMRFFFLYTGYACIITKCRFSVI